MNIKKRIVQLDLDCYKNNIEVEDEELKNYIKGKVKDAGANVVYIQLGSEDRVCGDYRTSDRLMFDPKPYVGNATVMGGDVFRRAVKITRELIPKCQILAWAPTLYSAFLIDDDSDTVSTAEDYGGCCKWYKRATPFQEETRTRLNAFFYALGRCTDELDGIMFQDDLVLSDWEDISDAGRAVLNNRYGLEYASQPQLYDFLSEQGENSRYFFNNRDWRFYKTSMLDNLSIECFNAFKDGYKSVFPARFRKRQKNKATRLKCARDYYSSAIFSRSGQTGDWFGQNIDTALNLYDHVVVMAYAGMNSDNRYALDSYEVEEWLTRLVKKANRIANSNGRYRANKLVFKLQSIIWDGDSGGVTADVLKKNVRTLLAAGAVNVGLYPAPELVSRFDLRTL